MPRPALYAGSEDGVQVSLSHMTRKLTSNTNLHIVIHSKSEIEMASLC